MKKKILFFLFAALLIKGGTLYAENFHIRVLYNMGFSQDTQKLGWGEKIYHEDASFNLNYNLNKGNSFSGAFGFYFARNMAVEFGADIGSRRLNYEYTASIPHPISIAKPRTADQSGKATLKENILFLNILLRIPAGKIEFDIFGGPAYFLSSANIVNSINLSDPYPFDNLSLRSTDEQIEESSFGFNVGGCLGFNFGGGMGLSINAQYFSGKATFSPSTGLPGTTFVLGGLKAGLGLIVRF